MRTSGDDIAEVLALLGVRPVWDDASRRVVGLEAIAARPSWAGPASTSPCASPASSATPSRTCVAMLDDAVQLVADLDEPAEDNYVRAHAEADLAEHGDERRATTRIFGSKPGTYGAGPAAADRQPATGATTPTSPRSTPPGAASPTAAASTARPPRDDMETAYRRIAVAAKNTDTREHDIADSDDYFQYHGGMVATVRALTGTRAGGLHRRLHPPRRGPHPHAVRGDRPGVPRPGGQPALDRRRCAGTATRARSRWPRPSTTCSATTPPPASWPTGCTRSSPRSYVLDEENRKFLAESNPWALHGMAERLLEAADRGMWAEPEPATLDGLRQVLLETEGDLEG